ncbi:PepSY domain-containing protein [Methyloversatilis sp.]|uniref:PepSY domain-containing protein n=1 Tax=Methyloversatilis sp. TaxID=2569862 RepID=UPI0027352217|nr:PepSY domain-containing protein [Methyloversatilis sp.]MDP2870528.1 PepSY domain-containing protein [Methyloversatilis sp.]MDP3286696.1 PepSY domain-containing protein [Methyloversatilis sp.]MDP3455844.1 PepSY domain-containing protein [Methyloversatilis sp.]MDP3578070.1 PepSY domain-containing protein [Methyloversatilis sp.]
MTTRRLLLFLAIPLLVLGALAASVFYMPMGFADDDHIRARELSQRGEILSLEKISELAKAVRPGKLIDIDLERKRELWIYEVELLDDQGRVWEMKLDARNGELLKLEQDD